FEYYFAAMRLTNGAALLIAGAAGALAALYRRAWWPVVLLALPPAFYLWSIYSASTPLYVPALWPYTWYNTRYGLAVLPLAALAAGALVTVIPAKARMLAALLLAAGISGAAARA